MSRDVGRDWRTRSLCARPRTKNTRLVPWEARLGTTIVLTDDKIEAVGPSSFRAQHTIGLDLITSKMRKLAVEAELTTPHLADI